MNRSDYVTINGVDGFWTPYVDGAFTTEEEFGLIDEMTLSITEEELKHISRTCGSVGIADKIVVVSTDIQAEIVSPEISPKMLARAFRGTLTETVVASGTATEDAVTITLLDTAYPLSKRHVSNVSVNDTAGQVGIAFTENTDYIIDYDKGTITAVTGGGISALDVVHVEFDNVAYTEWSIAGFNASNAIGKLRLEACAVEGMDIEYTLEKVQLKLNGSYTMVSAEDFASVGLVATLLADTTITNPNLSQLINIKGDDLFV